MASSLLTRLTTGSRRVTLQLCVALGWVLLGAFAAGAEPAAGVVQFGSHGERAGQFIEPNGIAVDQESGDVYVLDSNNERVERFTREGSFLRAWGWGVADGKTAAPQTCTKATGCYAGLRGAGAGQLGFAEGVAVDNDPHSGSHHDVYVVDIGNHRVEKFSPTGKFLLMFGGQVNETARKRGETANEDVCPVRPADRCTGGTTGAAHGQFEFPVEGNFIAVGSTGTVYVGDRNRVEEFSPGGVYRSQVALLPNPLAGDTEAGGTIALAVDPRGDLYVVRNGVNGVRRYTPRGKPQQTLDAEGEPESNEGPTPTIAVGPSGRVFVDYHVNEQHRLVEYNSTGAEVVSFDAGKEDGLHGIAYGDAIGRLYIVNTNNGVTPLLARVRLIVPPRPTVGPRPISSVFSGFTIVNWTRF